jgi:phosphoenolpyruvate carboxylase
VAGGNPYRILLGEVRSRLLATRRRMEELLAGQVPAADGDWYESEDQLLEPLLACYWSLWECGGGIIAEGRLLDLLRRIYCFGLSLMKLDLRQESTRHTDCLAEVTQHLGLGSYAEWDEDRRLAFLTEELGGKRPLIPPSMPFSPESREVMDTFKVAAVLGRQCLSAYVISMATRASDVLAVELLQQEARLMVRSQPRPRARSARARMRTARRLLQRTSPCPKAGLLWIHAPPARSPPSRLLPFTPPKTNHTDAGAGREHRVSPAARVAAAARGAAV